MFFRTLTFSCVREIRVQQNNFLIDNGCKGIEKSESMLHLKQQFPQANKILNSNTKSNEAGLNKKLIIKYAAYIRSTNLKNNLACEWLSSWLNKLIVRNVSFSLTHTPEGGGAVGVGSCVLVMKIIIRIEYKTWNCVLTLTLYPMKKVNNWHSFVVVRITNPKKAIGLVDLTKNRKQSLNGAVVQRSVTQVSDNSFMWMKILFEEIHAKN